jgi:peptide/nickel transport system substrate-binding protein
VLGSFTNANPLYATNSVDSSVAHLVFAGLLKYDQNNQLVGDLAKDWSSDSRGAVYTVHLRPKLVWQDGVPLTSDDVLFTYQTIQNADAESPLANSWKGITVSAPDPLTVVFKLPNTLSSFPYSMTNGIAPKHLLAGVAMGQLRSVSFNTASPVGAGPFKWSAIEVKGDTPEQREERIGLVPNESYYGGKPKLSQFIIRAFHNEKNLQASFKNQELNGASGLAQLPQSIAKRPGVHSYDVPLTGEVMVFLKNTQEILSDVNVRKALVQATNSAVVVGGLGFPVVSAREPLLEKQIGYNPSLGQLPFNPDAARNLLASAGWVPDATGVRHKNGKALSFNLLSQDTEEYAYVTQTLQKQWQAVGADAKVTLQSGPDLQNVIASHAYDVLVYGIAIGVDPDVFAYWHSSQADIRSPNRLNLSEYKSSTADQALEAGRTRTDPAVRAVKYKPFLESWRNDAPGIALYQPRFLYVTYGQLFGFNPRSVNTAADRYGNVSNWMILQRRVTN